MTAAVLWDLDGTLVDSEEFHWQSWVHALDQDGVRVTPHSARHACASQLSELGLDEEDGAAVLGHTSGRVTRGIYVQAFDRDKREAHAITRSPTKALRRDRAREDGSAVCGQSRLRRIPSPPRRPKTPRRSSYLVCWL